MANSDSIKTLKVRFHSRERLLVTFELMVVCKKVLYYAALLPNQVFPGHRGRIYRDSNPHWCQFVVTNSFVGVGRRARLQFLKILDTLEKNRILKKAHKWDPQVHVNTLRL